MIERPADALILATWIVGALTFPLQITTFRNTTYWMRIFSAWFFQVGIIGLCVWLSLRFSIEQYRSDFHEFATSLGPLFGTVHVLVLFIIPLSPVGTYLQIRDAKRHPMKMERYTNGQKILVPDLARSGYCDMSDHN